MEQSLFRIADVMQCPLEYKDGNIIGTAAFGYNPLPGLDIVIPITAKRVSHNEQTSVLFQLVGHLWALVGFYRKTNALTLFLIDASKIDADGVMITPDHVVSKLNSLRESVDLLRPGIVRSFIWKGTNWEPFKLPK